MTSVLYEYIFIVTIAKCPIKSWLENCFSIGLTLPKGVKHTHTLPASSLLV